MVRARGRLMLASGTILTLLVALGAAVPAHAVTPAKVGLLLKANSTNGLIMAGRPTSIEVRGARLAGVYMTDLDYYNYADPWHTNLDWKFLGFSSPKVAIPHTFKDPGYYGFKLQLGPGKAVYQELAVYTRYPARYLNGPGPTSFGPLLLEDAEYAYAGGTPTLYVGRPDGCRFADVGAKTDVGSLTISIHSEGANPVTAVATPGVPVVLTNVRVSGGSTLDVTAAGGADYPNAMIGSTWTCTSNPFDG